MLYVEAMMQLNAFLVYSFVWQILLSPYGNGLFYIFVFKNFVWHHNVFILSMN